MAERPGTFRNPDFTGGVAVVTGAGRGIGAAIARDLAASGARVVINGRHREPLETVCREITAAGCTAELVPGSITDPGHLEALMSHAAGPGGVINVLVNNAGTTGPTTPLSELSLQDWQQTIDANLTGVFLACRAAIPFLRAAGNGKIVNIGSATGKRPLVNRAPYAAAKIGIVGLTRTLAHELGPDGISVNTISPFLVDNARLDGVISTMSAARGISKETLWKEFTQETALGRAVTEADVSRLVLFLSSSAADGITGEDWNVTAGSIMY
ncbi:MAG: SDR family NAD(P)-dependent oxidoreductase [Streptosporangiaceae bacterium]